MAWSLKDLLGRKKQSEPAAPQQLTTGTLNNPLPGDFSFNTQDKQINRQPYPDITRGLRFNNGQLLPKPRVNFNMPDLESPQNISPEDLGMYGDSQGNKWFEDDAGRRITPAPPKTFDAPIYKPNQMPGTFRYPVQQQNNNLRRILGIEV